MTRYMVLVSWESGDTFGRDGGNVRPLGPMYKSWGPLLWTDRQQAEEAARRVKEHVEWASTYESYRQPVPPLPRPDYCPKETTIFDCDDPETNNARYFYVPCGDEERLVAAEWTGYFDLFWDARVVEEQSGEGGWKL